MPTLRWLTRDEDVRAAEKVPYRLLEEVPELGYGARDAGNMLIQGDNLGTLKALLPYYAGQVKCIYIDPPYNTGSAFEHYDDNLEHSKWLGIMQPRLELLRELLADDGLLFCQIDDHQGAYLTVLLDELFGRLNRMNVISVKMSEATGVKMSHAEKRLPKMKETILVYRKSERPKIRPISIPRGTWNGEYKELLLGLDREALDRLKELMDEDASNEADAQEANEIVRGATIVSLANYFKEQGIPTKDQDAFKWENAWRIIQAVGAGSIKKFAIERRQPGEAISSLLSSRNKLYIFKTEFSEESKDPRIRIIFADKYLTYHPGDFWPDIKTTGGVGAEGGVHFPKGKKPERLIERVLDIHTSSGDIVLDSFLGSGTTAAVAMKMGRRFIGIELGEHAITHCAPRLKSVVDGEQSGISESQNWKGGGGFRFYRLGPPVFTEDGQIQPGIRFPILAAHIWFAETGAPWSEPQRISPFLGAAGDHGYALLYNGILGDKSVSGGNVLTRKTLAAIRAAQGDFQGPLTVYGERTALSEATLKAEQIEFKQTPYDVKARK
jgi:adenine-specific DNA-methyltransferase